MHPAFELRDQVLLIATVVGLEDQTSRGGLPVVGQVEPMADLVEQPRLAFSHGCNPLGCNFRLSVNSCGDAREHGPEGSSLTRRPARGAVIRRWMLNGDAQGTYPD